MLNIMRQARQSRSLNLEEPMPRHPKILSPEDPSFLQQSKPSDTTPLEKLTLLLGWLTAIALGGYQTWLSRHTMNYYDGISYLDLIDAFLKGQWQEVFNSYWNPLYPGLLALGFWLLKPPPEKEFLTLHLVNFGIYLLSLACFEFFLRQLFRHLQQRFSLLSPKRLILFRVIAYTLFIYFSLIFQRVPLETPDMCLAGLIYLAEGLFLKIYQEEGSWVPPFLLGLVLGIGYLAKAVMLPLGLLMILVAGRVIQGHRSQRRVGLLLTGFLLVTSPYILALSLTKGEFTLGQTGQMNYLWYVHRVRFYTYQSDYPVRGKALHPLRKLSNHPLIYEYGTPIKGTYPRWYDPFYWYEGIQPQWNLKAQLWALGRNLLRCARIFTFWLSEILVIFLLCYFLSSNRSLWKKEIKTLWFLLLPSLFALALYSLVIIEKRYIGAFLLISWIALLSGLTFAQFPKKRKGIVYASLLWMILLLGIKISSVTANDSLYYQKLFQSPAYPKIANYLKQIGIRPGDKVACIGYANWENHVFWARLARVRIVAEVPASNMNPFWTIYGRKGKEILKTFRRTGAKILVVQYVPEWALSDGWKKIPGTNYYFYRLH